MNYFKTSTHNGRGASWVFLFVCGGLSALIWWGEESNKFSTLACALCVCGIAGWIVQFAHRHNACADKNLWLRMIGIRILLATILIGLFWYKSDLSHKSSSMQIDGIGFDPVRWDEMGEQLAKQGIFGSSKDVYRYGKEGLIYYIASIYSIFGASCVYVAWFNALIAVATLLLLTYWIRKHFGSQSRWDLMAYGLFIPESLWYGSLILKEVHNGFFFVLFMVCYERLFLNASIIKSKKKWIIYIILAIIGLFIFQRMHFVTMIGFVVFINIMFVRSKGSISKKFIIGLIFGCILASEHLFTSNAELISNENVQIQDAVLQGSDMFATDNSINTILIGKDILQKAIFSIPRTIFLQVTPFPRLEIWSYWGSADDWLAMGNTASRLSVILLLILSPALVAISVKAFTNSEASLARVPLSMYVACMFAMANGVMMFHERWRSSLWPIWLALVLIGWPYRKKFNWIISVVPTGGLLLFYLLKSMS